MGRSLVDLRTSISGEREEGGEGEGRGEGERERREGGEGGRERGRREGRGGEGGRERGGREGGGRGRERRVRGGGRGRERRVRVERERGEKEGVCTRNEISRFSPPQMFIPMSYPPM